MNFEKQPKHGREETEEHKNPEIDLGRVILGLLEESKKSLYAGLEALDKMPRLKDCNFTIEVEQNEITLNREDGHVLRLSTFLPNGYKFTKGQEFICKTNRKEVQVAEGRVESRGFLLSCFHEIGHSHEGRSHSRLKLTIVTLQMLFKIIKGLSIKVTKEKREGKTHRTINVNAPTNLDDIVPEWFREEKRDADVISERNAWAYALKELRKLEKEGFDVFSGFTDNSDIINHVHYSLATYDFQDKKDSFFRDPKKFIEEVVAGEGGRGFLRSNSFRK